MEFRKSSTIYKKLATGRSFNDKSAYDGVFAAPSKRGTPVFSAGLEDYREIFGGSRGSSIPILDFSALQEKKPSIDVRNWKLEYSQVFGTLEELDFAVPYEELKGEPKKADTSSERPPSTAGRVSPPVGKGSSTDLEKDEIFSHEYQSLDATKKFNMAYNKVNQGRNDSTKGITHVVQLQASSGYTSIFNEFSPLQASEGGKPASKADDDIRNRIKTVGSARDTKDHPSARLGRQTSRENGFQNKDDWYGNHSLKMKFDSCNLDQGSCSVEPTIFSRSAQVGKNLSYSETSMASNSEVCDACEKAGTVCSPPCFDKEVDVNSVAAASIAALRMAIEDAQAKIKIAKELMERRKVGLHGRKMSFADQLNDEERRESGDSFTLARSKDEKSQETCRKPEAMVNPSSEIRNQNLRELLEVASVEIQFKNIASGQAHCRPEESELLGKEKFYELDRADNKPFENAYHDETLTKLPHTYDQKQNKTTEKTIDNPEEFSMTLHRVEASNGKECREEKIHVVKEKGFSKEIKLSREMDFQEDDESTATTIQKLDETEERVGISYEKEKCGSREKENQQKLVKDNEKLETQELEENTVKKEIKADECVEDEMFKIIFMQNENETVEKVQMSYEKKNLGKGMEEQLEGRESFPGDENLETKKLDENSAMIPMMARDWVEYLKVKMGFKQDKNVIRENVLMSYETENCQERLGEHLKGKESVQDGQKLEAKELEELTVKQQVKGHERIEGEKLKMIYGQDKNEIRRKDFVCGEDTDKKPAEVDELGRVKDCINDFRIGVETELEENGESRGNKKHQKAGEDEEMIADLSNQIEGKRIDLKFDKIAETDIKITQDGLNSWESRLEVTEDLCNWNLSDNLNKNGGACENLDHGKIVEGTSNHPLCEDSKNNFDHPLCEDSRNKMEVVKTSVETKRIEKDSEEIMQANEVEENASLRTPFLAEDTFILKSEMESSNAVEEFSQNVSSDPHKNDFTSEIGAEEFASEVEEVHEFVMEHEVFGSLQKEGNNVQSNDDKGLRSNIDDLNECYPLRMSEENGKLTVAAEETITSTTTIEVHQASETVEECCTNDIIDVNNSGQAPQSCENKKSQITAIDDENDPVTSPTEDQEISDTMNHGNNRMASDWPHLSEEDKFIKTLDRDTNQNVRVNGEKHHEFVMEHEDFGSLQKEGNNVQSNDDKGLRSNIDDLNECYPLRMSEENEKLTVAAEETITSTTTIEVHQASETVEECCTNDIFDVNYSGQVPQSYENKKSQITAIDDENDPVTSPTEDQEISNTMNHGNNRMASDWPHLSEEDKFIKKALDRETNQNVIVNEEKHQTTQTLEDMGMNDALQNEGRLESVVNNPECAHTNGMNEGTEKCFEIDEEIETEMPDIEGDKKQQIVPPKTVTEINFEKPAEVENGHQRKNEESKESEEEKGQSDVANEAQQHMVTPKEGGTQTEYKSERLLEVEKEHQRKIDEAKESEKENKQGDLENEQNQQIIPPKEGTQTKHEIERLAEAEKEDLKKTDEVKEMEKEKERERIAVERAIREARERAFSEARERVVAERVSAQTRVKEKNTAREQPGKISTESNNKLGAEKASIEAKLRAERNAVERATAEARERALEKAMSRKAFSEAKNLAEKIVEEKLSNAASDSERRDFPFNYNNTSASTSSRNTTFSNVGENSNGSIGETALRHKAKLEKHHRTVERVAKALAEKNFRDRLAQQEQAERNRLAESLDANVKRWSSGKEGNLRLLLSTLQYILGPDSGWQPIPLTDILATTAVKKAYRKATLWVHPDKLQQRGASIQQKYVCEKVFDLLQAAWNRFNTEER